MTNQQPNAQTPTPDKNVKNVKNDKDGNVGAKPKPHCVDDFNSRTDVDGKNDSGPDPEIHGREIPPQ